MRWQRHARGRRRHVPAAAAAPTAAAAAAAGCPVHSSVLQQQQKGWQWHCLQWHCWQWPTGGQWHTGGQWQGLSSKRMAPGTAPRNGTRFSTQTAKNSTHPPTPLLPSATPLSKHIGHALLVLLHWVWFSLSWYLQPPPHPSFPSVIGTQPLPVATPDVLTSCPLIPCL